MFNSCTTVVPRLYQCGELIDVVDTELHLGNRIYNNVYKKNVEGMVSDFYRRSNHVISNFKMCDSFTLRNLHASYCTSFYGIELYDFSKGYMSDLFVWRKCIRRIYSIPYRTHNFIVSYLGHCLIIQLHRRLAKYMYNLLHHCNPVVHSIVNHKLNVLPNSILNENFKYLSFKYKLGDLDWKMSLNHIIRKIIHTPVYEQECICTTVTELIQMREGILECDIICNVDTIKALIDDVCIS